MSTPLGEFRFEYISSILLASLRHWRDYISWGSKAVAVYEQIEHIYGLYSGSTDQLVEKTSHFDDRVKELERYLTVDLIRQMDTKNGNEPSYIDRLIAHLDTATDTLTSMAGADTTSEATSTSRRHLQHVSAEMQAAFVEYGFCQICEGICSVEEARQKFETLFNKLNSLERLHAPAKSPSEELSIESIQEAMASYSGIQQAMTENNMELMSAHDAKARRRLDALLESMCAYISIESPVFMTYVAAQSLLLKPIVKSLFHEPAKQTIDAHMIHPGTRGWLLDRIQHWLTIGEKRMFVLAGMPGIGKSALSAAVCKLYSYNVKAQYFYSKDTSSAGNSVISLVQSIASDLCRTLPEYLNWLDDNCSSSDLDRVVRTSWRACHELLLKKPLQALYGVRKGSNHRAVNTRVNAGQSVGSLMCDPACRNENGRSGAERASQPWDKTGVAGLLRDPITGSSLSGAVSDKRQLIIIDGLHRCPRSEWVDVKAFIDSLVTDLPPAMRLLITIQHADMTELLPRDGIDTEFVFLESRSSINRHISDLEVYLCSSLGAVLSGEDDSVAPGRARADETTLQNIIDELLKRSAGRFDYAIELMESFSREMRVSGQFLSSVKKAAMPVERRHHADFDVNVGEFASPFRSYRDKEGRNVAVRVMRQSKYPMDRTRVALIRARQRLHYE